MLPVQKTFQMKKKQSNAHCIANRGDLLMASDIVPGFGQTLTVGNNNYVSIFPDSREEADRLFKGLSEGGNIEMPIEDQFWGDYFGSFQDKFGVHWMVNYNDEYAK